MPCDSDIQVRALSFLFVACAGTLLRSEELPIHAAGPDSVVVRLQLSEAGDFEFGEALKRLDALAIDWQRPRQAPPETTSGGDVLRSVGERGELPIASPAPVYRARDSSLDWETKATVVEPTAPTFKVSGFFQVDAGFFSQDANSRTTLADPFPGVPGATPGIADGDLQNGADFRRTRINVLGALAEFVNYKIEVDFSAIGRPSLMDVWGEWTHLPLLQNVRVGHIRQPFSLVALTNVRHQLFLEHPLPFIAFVPFRRVGAMTYGQFPDKIGTYGVSVFRTEDDAFGDSVGDGGGYGVSTRLTRLMWYDEPTQGRYLLHLGGGYDFSDPSTQLYRAAAVPEFFLGSTALTGTPVFFVPPFVDTGSVPAHNFNIFDVELLAQAGPFHVQSEFMQTLVNQSGGPLVLLTGGYVQAGWLLTGENHNYNRDTGVIEDVTPFEDFFCLGRRRGFGRGAWELALRWSYLDLNDQNVSGGKLTDMTVGVNWYLNRYAKLQFNYIVAMLDSPSHGRSDTNIFALRSHVGY